MKGVRTVPRPPKTPKVRQENTFIWSVQQRTRGEARARYWQEQAKLARVVKPAVKPADWYLIDHRPCRPRREIDKPKASRSQFSGDLPKTPAGMLPCRRGASALPSTRNGEIAVGEIVRLRSPIEFTAISDVHLSLMQPERVRSYQRSGVAGAI